MKKLSALLLMLVLLLGLFSGCEAEEDEPRRFSRTEEVTEETQGALEVLLLDTIHANDTVRTFEYDDQYMPTKMTLYQSGSHSYDVIYEISPDLSMISKQTQTESGMLSRVETCFDSNGNRTQVLNYFVPDEVSGQTFYTYDSQGRLTEQMEVGNEGKWTYAYEYDSEGRVSRCVRSWFDDEMEQTTYIHEADAIIAQMNSSDGTYQTTYTFDGAGNLIRQETKRIRFEFVYDKNGNLIGCTEQYGDMASIEYTFEYRKVQVSPEQAQKLEAWKSIIFEPTVFPW